LWAQAAEQRLAPLFYTAARGGRGMRDVVQWVYGQGGAELDRLTHQLIHQSGSQDERADAQQAYDAHLAFTQLAGETRGSIEGTAQILLSAYCSPTVVRSADGQDITANHLLDGANTVYLISDPRRSKLLRPILIGLLTELLDAAYETANRASNRRLAQPLLVCLDELGNAVPLPNLAEIASTAASHNIQLVSIFHDIAQARSRYRDQALTVINTTARACSSPASPTSRPSSTSQNSSATKRPKIAPSTPRRSVAGHSRLQTSSDRSNPSTDC
jgi:hypothetical protein